jgi:putative hydrolase of the HAD superfamily
LAHTSSFRYRAVLFDALGTLVALEPPWPLLRRTLSDRHEIEVSDGEAKSAMLAEMSYYRSHHMDGSDPDSLAELRRRCASVLRDHLPQTAGLEPDALVDLLLDSLRFTPMDDAAPALAALRGAGLRLAVVSNWDCSLHSVLADLGLAAAVDTVVVSAEVGSPKPDPAIFEEALARLRCKAGEALFVGDSLETDVLGARGAGIRGLLLDRGDSTADTSPDIERVYSLHDLVELVEARSYS